MSGGGIVTSNSFESDLGAFVRTYIGANYANYPVEYPSMFEIRAVDRQSLSFAKDAGLGRAQIIGEGEAPRMDTMGESWKKTLYWTVWANAFEVTRLAREDAQTNHVMNKKSKELMKSMVDTQEQTCADVYNRAETAGYVGGDGVVLLSNSHPLKSGDVNRNRLTTPADLNEASLEQSIIDISKFVNERGLKCKFKAKDLIIPKESCFIAKRILGSDKQSDVFSNNLNALKELGYLQGMPVVSHYLTDTNSFFLRTDAEDGMVMHKRRGIEIDTDHDVLTGNMIILATMRFGADFLDPLGLFGSMGAT